MKDIENKLDDKIALENDSLKNLIENREIIEIKADFELKM